MWVFDPPGRSYIELPLNILQLILKKYHHALSWMYFCGYFALRNGPNWEVIFIIAIFGDIFGQNLGISPPPGCPYIWLPPTVLQLMLKKYHHAFSWMYFCGYIKWSKLGSYFHNTNIWGHFWSKFGYLTPRGDHIYGYPQLFSN